MNVDDVLYTPVGGAFVCDAQPLSHGFREFRYYFRNTLYCRRAEDLSSTVAAGITVAGPGPLLRAIQDDGRVIY